MNFGLDYKLEDFAPFRERTEFERTKIVDYFPMFVATAASDRGRAFIRTMHQWGLAPRKSIRQRREREAPGRHTRTQVLARVEFYGGLCWICREAPHETIDHVKPITKGGSNWPANLRPACRSCNSRKKDKWPFVVAA